MSRRFLYFLSSLGLSSFPSCNSTENLITSTDPNPISPSASNNSVYFRPNSNQKIKIPIDYSMVMEHEGWIGCYDVVKRNPKWVAYHLSHENIMAFEEVWRQNKSENKSNKEKKMGEVGIIDKEEGLVKVHDELRGEGNCREIKLPNRGNAHFHADERLPVEFRVGTLAFQNSGFDRGHLVPSADMKFISQEAVNGSFVFNNVSPQVPSFNRVFWEHIEHFVRNLATFHFNDVYVISGLILPTIYVYSGPIFAPQKSVSGKSFINYEQVNDSIAVPSHFFKVVVAENYLHDPNVIGPHVLSLIVPNQTVDESKSIEDFQVSTKVITLMTGLSFEHIDRTSAYDINTTVSNNNLCSLIPCNFEKFKGFSKKYI